MEVGMYTLSEINELFVLQDEYEVNGSTLESGFYRL